MISLCIGIEALNDRCARARHTVEYDRTKGTLRILFKRTARWQTNNEGGSLC